MPNPTICDLVTQWVNDHYGHLIWIDGTFVSTTKEHQVLIFYRKLGGDHKVYLLSFNSRCCIWRHEISDRSVTNTIISDTLEPASPEFFNRLDGYIRYAFSRVPQ